MSGHGGEGPSSPLRSVLSLTTAVVASGGAAWALVALVMHHATR